MITYAACVTIAVLAILLASGFVQEVMGSQSNYTLTNTQAGRLLVAVAVVWLVSFCPAGAALTGAWLGGFLVLGSVAMWGILNAALGPVPYTVKSSRLIEARPPRGYQRMNLEMRAVWPVANATPKRHTVYC